MKNWIFLIAFLFPNVLLAQNRISLSGYVSDSLTGEALIGASIYDTQSLNGCTTNEFGYFSLNVVFQKDVVIKASYTGYKSQSLVLNENNLRVNFKLQPGLRIDEVLVETESPQISRQENVNTVRLSMKEVKKLPTLFGEQDLVQALQLMPGIQSGGEANSQLFVRGGSPDQNLVLLDDVPLYYISHFSGLFSVFNTDAINYVEISKGGFPARYGGRLSSVLDVRMKDGNLYNREGNCTVGLLSSRISYEGPVQKGRSSYIISARRSMLPAMNLITNGLLNNSFYDINGKFNYKVDDNNRLFLSLYTGNDVVNVKQYNPEASGNDLVFKTSRNWGNSLGSLRWNHIYTQKLFSNLNLSIVDYKYTSNQFRSYTANEVDYTIENQLKSGIADVSANYNLKWFYNSAISLRGGIQSTSHIFTPNNESRHQETSTGLVADSSFVSRVVGWENALYAEGEINYEKLGGNLGGRLASYSVNGKTFVHLEPRITLNYKLFRHLQLNASYTQMNQFVHLLSYSTGGFPSEYWMPATEIATPEFSQQFSLGLGSNFLNDTYTLSLIAYQKSLENLVSFKEGASLYGNFDRWENVVETGGAGDSKGIELLFQKLKGRTTGWLSTTVAKASRQFENINNGNAYPFDYDRRLDISLVVNYQLNEKVELSAVWNYGSGYPVTLAKGKYQFKYNQEIIVWDERNGSRMKDYHRLDLAINYPYTIGKFDGTFSISLLNAYNRKNAFFYFYIDFGDGTKLYQQSLIQFLPSFSYSFKF
ncbi:MAG: carboxypeptidase-like regulatory domain-containing protein [Prolixibacteraceae bacterium]